MIAILIAVVAVIVATAIVLTSRAGRSARFPRWMDWALTLPTATAFALILVTRYGPFTRGSSWVALGFPVIAATTFLSLFVSLIALAVLVKKPVLRTSRNFILTLISLSIPLGFTLLISYSAIMPSYPRPGRCTGANCDNASSNQRLERP
jgi:hypothetical protein